MKKIGIKIPYKLELVKKFLEDDDKYMIKVSSDMNGVNLLTIWWSE